MIQMMCSLRCQNLRKRVLIPQITTATCCPRGKKRDMIQPQRLISKVLWWNTSIPSLRSDPLAAWLTSMMAIRKDHLQITGTKSSFRLSSTTLYATKLNMVKRIASKSSPIMYRWLTRNFRPYGWTCKQIGHLWRISCTMQGLRISTRSPQFCQQSRDPTKWTLKHKTSRLAISTWSMKEAILACKRTKSTKIWPRSEASSAMLTWVNIPHINSWIRMSGDPKLRL